MNSYADGYMRVKVVKEVGALLDHILVCYVIGYYLYQEIQAVENYQKDVRDREPDLPCYMR